MREKPLILVAEDENNLLEIITTKLLASGYDVVGVLNGEEAVKKAGELLPDLVLMDIRMPKMNGTDAALALKENPATESIRVAFLTSQADPWPGIAGNNQNAARELGFDDFLQKTDDLDTNMTKIKEILSRPPRPPQRDL